MNSDKKKYGSEPVGHRIKDAMEVLNLNQTTLTNALNEAGIKIERSKVTKWISGERALTKVSELVALREVLDVSIDYLLFGEGHAKSIEPDVTAAMKLTGLSEDALLLLSEISNDSHPDIQMIGKSFQVEMHENAPLVNCFILKGIEKIMSELSDYSNDQRDAKTLIENANNFINSPYSDPSAINGKIHEIQFMLNRLRLRSLSFGDICKTVGDNVFETEKTLTELKRILKTLQEKNHEYLMNLSNQGNQSKEEEV